MAFENFEEFKNMYFRYVSKISEEELEYCRKEYKRLSLKLEDDNYFEPLKDDNILKKYVDKWLSLFESSIIKETEIVVLMMPSFEHPSLLKIEENKGVYNLYFKYLGNDFVQENYGNQELMRNSLKLYQNQVEQKLTTDLWALFSDTIKTAQEPKSNTYTLDGVMFYIIKNLNGNIQVVSKNLTEITTKTGKITNLIEELTASILNYTFTISVSDLQKKIDQIFNLSN
jgi:hypothetical protein